MKDHTKARTASALVPLDLCRHRQHVNPLVKFSLSGSFNSLPWSFISMWRYQDPAAVQRIVSPVGYVIENSIWHDVLRLLRPKFVTLF